MDLASATSSSKLSAFLHPSCGCNMHTMPEQHCTCITRLCRQYLPALEPPYPSLFNPPSKTTHNHPQPPKIGQRNCMRAMAKPLIYSNAVSVARKTIQTVYRAHWVSVLLLPMHIRLCWSCLLRKSCSHSNNSMCSTLFPKYTQHFVEGG